MMEKTMANDLTQLLSPTLIYMLFCYFVTLAIRKGIELKWPGVKVKEWWTDFLPALPVVIGFAFAYAPKYPIPAAFIASPWSKGMWGFVAGALSTWSYGIVQAVFKRMFGIDISTFSKSNRPGPVPGTTVVVVVPPHDQMPTVPDVEKKP